MSHGAPLTAESAAMYDDVVVPRYLSFFGALLSEAFILHPQPHIAQLGCRTGFPGLALHACSPGGTLIGIDPSSDAIERARANAGAVAGFRGDYYVAPGLPTPLPDSAFTHSLALHPICNATERAAILAELYRVLAPGGQALLALPLRGSFPEIADMMREYALVRDLPAFASAIDAAQLSRPTPETLAEELESAGFVEVDVDVRMMTITFGTGREFLDDPIARLMILPEAVATLDVPSGVPEDVVPEALAYAQDAIQKYWAEGPFELTVNIGCTSGRRPLT